MRRREAELVYLSGLQDLQKLRILFKTLVEPFLFSRDGKSSDERARSKMSGLQEIGSKSGGRSTRWMGFERKEAS